MTIQAGDEIFINGEWLELCSSPFDDFLPYLKPYISFEWYLTSCWRGYTAKWKLADGILFLVELNGDISYQDETISISIDYFFPLSDKVKAWWFTGDLTIPQGEPYGWYRNIGDVFEEYLLIHIESGKETSRRIKKKKINLADEELRLYKNSEA